MGLYKRSGSIAAHAHIKWEKGHSALGVPTYHVLHHILSNTLSLLKCQSPKILCLGTFNYHHAPLHLLHGCTCSHFLSPTMSGELEALLALLKLYN